MGGHRRPRDLRVAHDHDVLHRDVKPANVVVDEGDPITRAVLIDFGLALSAGLEPSVRDEPVGTARYLAPEASGLIDVPVDERADLYSLGVLLFGCLAGHPPFQAADVGTVLRQHLTTPAPALRSLAVRPPGPRRRRRPPAPQGPERPLPVRRGGAGRPRGPDRRPRAGRGRAPRHRRLPRPPQRPHQPAFVGRTVELATLSHLLIQAGRGNGGLVLVEAESGGGKTRLLDELALQAGPATWTLRGQKVDHAAQRPFQLLDGVTGGGVASTAEQPDLAARLRERLDDWTEAVVAALPDLAETLGEADPRRLGPEAYGEVRSIEALRALLDGLGERDRPALVLLDDGQWGDSFTARLLARWQERTAERSCHVLVVAAFRSEEVGPEHALRSLRPLATLALGPFTPDDVAHLCSSMAGALPAEAIDTIVRVAGGSPFMASAVLRGMVESGALGRAGRSTRSPWPTFRRLGGRRCSSSGVWSCSRPRPSSCSPSPCSARSSTSVWPSSSPARPRRTSSPRWWTPAGGRSSGSTRRRTGARSPTTSCAKRSSLASPTTTAGPFTGGRPTSWRRPTPIASSTWPTTSTPAARVSGPSATR